MSTVYDSVISKVTLRPQAATAATVNGIGVDTAGFNSAAVLLEVGAVSGASPTLDIKIQDSANNSSFADVSGLTFTQVTAANNSQALRIEGLNTATRRRYLRAVATLAGTSPNFTLKVDIVLGKSFKVPVQ